MFTFLRRLWNGDATESERFRKNLNRLEAKEKELEELKEKLEGVSEQSSEKSQVYRKINSSFPPKGEDDD
jgi:chromosome condensin MukBEF ATPase and DNA-binding subunit MukB